MICLMKNKTIIISDIKQTLKNKVERIHIIGSFQNEHWDSNRSDIDLVCIDSSFAESPFFVNLYYVKRCLSKLPFKFDLFLYTWKQFYAKMEENTRFRNEIANSIIL